ncbi:MAG: hypothetical protein EXS35_01170 [Pedosphaera sp.]|nr:hypothetical protein [Pedosphaera sp.]
MKSKLTKARPQSSMSLGIIDRRNNSVVSSVPVEDSQNPHILPPSDAFIWHYVRFDYFQFLLQNKALWLTRLDKQTDKNDGMYSDTNAHKWTPVVQNLLEHAGFTVQSEKNEWSQFQWNNQIFRQRAFIHCWSIRKKESAWMWNSFVSGEPRSVAVRSTVGSLQAALTGQPVEILRMFYYPAGQPRPDWSYTAPFAAKDRDAHIRESELRVLTMDGHDQPEAEYKLIPVDRKQLIRKVVIHPASPFGFRDEVRNMLKLHGVPAHVAGSQLRTGDLQAAALHGTR